MMTTLVKFAGFAALAAVTLTSTPAAADEYARWVDIENYGRTAIHGVHITSVHDGGWGRDLLGSRTIAPGEALRVEPRRHGGYCDFDVLISYANNAEVTLWDIDLCTITNIDVDEFSADEYSIY